jgi:hypothetical protein
MPLPKAVANSITQIGLRAIVIMFAIWLLLMLISLYHDGRAHAHDAQHLSDWIANQTYKSPNERFDQTVPASATLISQDNHYWGCGTYGGRFTGANERRCLFIKPSFSVIPLGSRGAG